MSLLWVHLPLSRTLSRSLWHHSQILTSTIMSLAPIKPSLKLPFLISKRKVRWSLSLLNHSLFSNITPWSDVSVLPSPQSVQQWVHLQDESVTAISCALNWEDWKEYSMNPKIFTPSPEPPSSFWSVQGYT